MGAIQKNKIIFYKNVSKKQPRDIREKITRENKKDLIKKTGIFLILIVIIIYFIGFAKF